MNYSYVLITAAKNEEDFIEQTIKSVIRQTILPVKWIILSDASTDCTDEIIRRYCTQYNFIQLFRIPEHTERNFASKVHALNRGYNLVRNLEYDFIGILDADITFEADYYEKLMNKFKDNPKLGLAGGKVYNFYNGKLHKEINSDNSVGNAVQFFRRECFDKIGHFVPLADGGEDGIAEISVMMHGWEVMSIKDISVLHHRRTGTNSLHLFSYKFRQGVVEYSLGYHPLFQFLKCVFRLYEDPYIIGSILRFTGYWWMTLKRKERPVSKDFVQFIRKIQIERINNIIPH
ncbi:MAG: glycosyltransferase [Methanococcaceae archaeon]